MQHKTVLMITLVVGFAMAACDSSDTIAPDEGYHRFPPRTFQQSQVMDDFVRNEFLEQSKAMGEEDISQRVDEPTQIIRLTLLPAMTFYTEAIRIEMSGDRITLTAKRASKSGRQDIGNLSPEKHAELTPQQWSELQAKLAHADFWNLPSSEKTIGLDGVFWIVEGVSGGRYHIVNRWSPGSESRYGQLTAYIMELADFR